MPLKLPYGIPETRLYDVRMLGLSLAVVLLMPLQAQYQWGIDFQRAFPVPTITDIGVVDLLPGRPPKVHVHIQHGPTLYVCGSDSKDKLKANGLNVGQRVEIHERGKYVGVRKPGQHKWVRLRLVEKTVLKNL